MVDFLIDIDFVSKVPELQNFLGIFLPTAIKDV
jgi:hypothetical protein